ncbi:MAG: hypothetical protein KME20_13115 [Kaiparowitsia implicata GSE-PSE-MK54-09C]|jgi:hypothetical protein|nr:hypothetical protein [Kaiparowitsia implicata GSE-PSE-MK54-09C]
MKPRITDATAWHQAELLMQPVFIRLIDNLRKALDESSWTGTYREDVVWAEDVSPAERQQVIQLQQQFAAAAPAAKAAIEAELAKLPQPTPIYSLCLQQGDRTLTIDLWQVCYQICFKNYSPVVNWADAVDVEIDMSLLDQFGDVDWQRLDAKTRHIVEQVFASLA